LTESRLPREVSLELRKRFHDAGVRLILLRRGARFTSGGRMCYFVRTDEREPYLGEMTLAGPEALLDIDLAQLSGGAVSEASRREEPLFLVCTHGRHDACCSIRGNQVSRVACAEPGYTAWESSHIGGDRFAANLVCFPHGVYYGRVAPDEVVMLMQSYRRGVLSIPHYRGRSCYTFAVQAAEHFVRVEAGLIRVDDLHLLESTRVDERLLEVVFELRDQRRAGVRVAIDETPEAYRLTCGATRLNAIPRYELVSCSIQ
jgi:hypothetical protein